MTFKLLSDHAWVADQTRGVKIPGFCPEELESEVVDFVLTKYRTDRVDPEGLWSHASVSVKRHLWRIARRERRRNHETRVDLIPERATMASSVVRLDRLRVWLRCCPDRRAVVLLKIIDLVMEGGSFRRAVAGIRKKRDLFRWVRAHYQEKTR